MKMKPFSILLPLFLVAVAGCNQTVSVSGTVSLDDGTPLKKGYINFNNGTYEARGVVTDGKYTVETDGRGLKPGNYKVFFSGTEGYRYEGTGEKKRAIIIPVIADKYSSAGTTDLTVSIKGTTDFSPKLEPAKK
jgi:hypothetical protein